MSKFEVLAKNERWVVLAGLALVAATGLILTVQLGDMLMVPAIFAGNSLAYPVLLFLMWWTMMMAMMLPSAAPAILTYAAVARKLSGKGVSLTPPAVFAAGYVTIWSVFSAAVMALQILANQKIGLSMMMAVTSQVIGGSLLVAAGLYQMSPFKYGCLRKCQMPLMYLARNWRSGYLGAFRMGLSHGLYCIGCCWALMGLLFYGGVMELRWIVGLALYVAAEKLIPAGNRLNRMSGLLLVGWGIWTISGAIV